MSELLTTSQAAELLKVSTSTLKRWADGGLVVFVRTQGGHRRFRQEDLNRLAHGGQEASPAGRWAEALLDPAQQQLSLEAMFYEARARLGSWWATAETLVLPAVFELYRRRDARTITVVQWQVAFERLNRALSRFAERLPVALDAPVVMLASLIGDRLHASLPAAEVCAAEAGWRCRVAGAVTLEDLAEELRREVPQALVVTASLRSDPEYVQRFAEALGPMALALHLPVGFMGMGAWPSDVPGATRLTRADQSLQWLQEIPRTRRAVMGDEGAAAV